MIIKKIEIHGFGRLDNRTYIIDRPFTQIFGENESGKSTLQLFIHAILFGFDDDASRPMEPRFASKYGGKITFDDAGQEITIKRTFKNQQEIVMIKQDDVARDEAWLRQRMNFISCDTYEQIFSFDVLGLQQVHHLTEDKLESYLLQAGVFGATEYASLETTLEDEKSALLTTDHEAGKLYMHLMELIHLEMQIREEKAKLEHYDLLVLEHEQIEKKINELKEYIKHLKKIRSDKQKELAHLDEIKEWKSLEFKLNIEPLTFPEHGIERFESLKKQIHLAKRDVATREEKLRQLKREHSTITLLPNEIYEQGLKLEQQEAVIKQHDKKVTQLERSLQEQNDHINGLHEDIGWQTEQQVTISETMKDNIVKYLSQSDQMCAQIEHLEREQKQLNEDIDALNNNIKDITKNIVSDDQFTTGEALERDKENLASKNELYSKVHFAQQQKEEKDLSRRKLYTWLYSLGSLIGIAVAIYLLYVAEIIPAMIVLVVPVILIIMLFTNKKIEQPANAIMQEEIQRLNSSISQLTKELTVPFDLDEQRRLKEQKRMLEFDKRSNEMKLDKLTASLSDAHDKYAKYMSELSKIKKEMNLSIEYENSLLMHAYRSIRKLIDLYSKRRSIEQAIIFEQQQIDNYKKRVLQFNPNETASILGVLFQNVSKVVQQEEKNRKQLSRVNEQITLMTKEYDWAKQALIDIETEMMQLFQEAHVEDESRYYEQEALYKTYVKDMQRFNELSHKLEEENFDYEHRSHLAHISLSDLRQAEINIHEQVDEYEAYLYDERLKRQEKAHVIRIMEENTALSDLTYRYTIEKNIVNRLAKEFTALNYVEILIRTHRDKVKGERIPYIIDVASKVFTQLTEGRYVEVRYDESLEVKHRDGQIYHPIELSQSTKELLYISMRLSLIQHLKSLYPMPIIIDDAFVHFDKHRKDFIIDFLMKQTEYQIMYFTCNKSLNIPAKSTIILERHDKERK